MMTSRKNGERTRVMIVEQDLEFGLKLADCSQLTAITRHSSGQSMAQSTG